MSICPLSLLLWQWNRNCIIDGLSVTRATPIPRLLTIFCVLFIFHPHLNIAPISDWRWEEDDSRPNKSDSAAGTLRLQLTETDRQSNSEVYIFITSCLSLPTHALLLLLRPVLLSWIAVFPVASLATSDQVNNWFINARRRILQPMLDHADNCNRLL